MIRDILSHALLAIAIWIIATIIIKKPNNKKCHNLKLCHQVSQIWNREGDDSKRKKNKKHKKKNKKGEEIQLQANRNIRVNTLGSKEDNDTQKEDQVENVSEKSQNEKQKIKHINFNLSQDKKDQAYQTQSKQMQSSQAQFFKIKNIQQEKSVKQIDQNRKTVVNNELQLIRSYFMDEFQQIIPYNGKNGLYRLCLQGSLKSINLEWHYTISYPKQIIDVKVNKDCLNPLQLQKIETIFKEQQHRAENQANYMYLFNLVTSIYQDMMITINSFPEQQSKSQKQLLGQKQMLSTPINQLDQNQFDLTRPHNDPKDLKTKKQIYGKILDQIFYLHDMIQGPDVSTMMKPKKDEAVKVKEQSTRGRYWTQFEQLQLIGEGGFGKVYKVRHKLDGNIYAIKKAIINYSDLHDRKMLKEVALLSKLNHPNIVRYYQSWLEDSTSIDQIAEDMDYINSQKSKIQELNNILRRWQHDRSGGIAFESGSQNSYQGSQVQNSGIVFEDDEDNDIVFQDGGQDMNLSNKSSINENSNYQNHSSQSSTVMKNLNNFPFKILYIAMEFCNGINLRQFINTRFDQQEQKIQILRGILEGLSYIHQKKIIHRDLKPANIFLTETNKVKIGDFGLATTEQRSISISMQSNDFDPLSDKTKAVGTGFYRSPEQLKSNKYDEKVDIYSLGIIMLQLFYPFTTIMGRADVLKEVTQNHKLPKDFVAEKSGTDILENIITSLSENPQNRPSASKLLESFRNKYFTQLVSCIANPKHFQFSELLNHLFDIKNQPVTALMWRDYFKSYQTSKLQKIYHIHRASLFPTLPLIPVQDFQILNGHRIAANRNNKYLLITNRGVVLEYTSNCLKTWLKYAKQDFKKKKMLSIQQQRSSIRRYTFQKIVNWQEPQKKDDLCFHERIVTAFDISYKLDEGFNAFYLCQILKISESITLTLNLTQKTPPVYLFHSQIYYLLAQKYQIPKESFYGVLLSINEDEFNQLSVNQKINHLSQKNLPINFVRKLCQTMQLQFQNPFELLEELQINRQSQICKLIEEQIFQLKRVRQRIKGQNKLLWKVLIPRANCNGFFWEIGLIKGITSIEQYAIGQQFCNYHIQMNLDPEREIVDVSIWCIGEYLQEEMQKIILECWKNGLTTRWYDWQIGEREDLNSRQSIILKKKNDRVHIMVRHNEGKKGDREERQSSFISLEQFNWDVLKQGFATAHSHSYH